MIKFFYLIFFVLFVLFSCTNNPFSDEKITVPKKQKVSGRVLLNNEMDHSNIIVYLDGLDILTTTDIYGDFTIEIPQPHLQPGNGLTGLYKIYYYVANFGLQSSTVLINNGSFVNNNADLDSDGHIRKVMVLKKILDITTTSNLASVAKDYLGFLDLAIRITSLTDSVIVSTYLVNENEFGAIYLESQDNQYMIQFKSNYKTIIVKTSEFWTMNIKWDVQADSLAIGTYTIIPYLFIHQAGVPEKLLRNLGEEPALYTEEFLSIPFRRTSPNLVISQSFSNL